MLEKNRICNEIIMQESLDELSDGDKLEYSLKL